MTIGARIILVTCDACGAEAALDSRAEPFGAGWDWAQASGQWCPGCKHDCVVCGGRTSRLTAWVTVPGLQRDRSRGDVAVCAKCCEAIEEARRPTLVTRLT